MPHSIIIIIFEASNSVLYETLLHFPALLRCFFSLVRNSAWAVLRCRVTFSRIVKRKSMEDFSGMPYNMIVAQLPLTNMVTNPLPTLDLHSLALYYILGLLYASSYFCVDY
jgi:hypothetical protein